MSSLCKLVFSFILPQTTALTRIYWHEVIWNSIMFKCEFNKRYVNRVLLRSSGTPYGLLNKKD